MTAPDGSPRGVHLVGSVPLRSAEEVFRAAGGALGERLRRIPDGETGERSDWIGWQFAVLARTPGLVEVPPAHGRYAARPHVKLTRAGGQAAPRFGALGYAEAAIASYATFSRLQLGGDLPERYRFQVSLPTPLAVVTAFVERQDRVAVEPAYEERLLAELDAIAAAIPHGRLAIQWDMPMEVGMLEGVIPSHLADVKPEILARVVRISGRVPPSVELGYHLCYGDFGHRHFKQPEDAALLTDVANAIAGAVRRPIQWVHMPVPRDRADEAYFAPLRGLALHPETKLYLGLVHATDGVEGARLRIEAARQVVSDFGVATECGMGRRPPETIPDLLAIHAEVAAPDRPEERGSR